jgi:hypothetical protein
MYTYFVGTKTDKPSHDNIVMAFLHIYSILKQRR